MLHKKWITGGTVVEEVIPFPEKPTLQGDAAGSGGIPARS
jgi:hypothetical protein